MTEAEWLTCGDPQKMIQFVSRRAWGDRRARLFSVACCRKLKVLPDDRLAGVIETAERFADRQADEVELSAAIGIATEAVEWEARHDMNSWQSHAAEVVAAATRFQPDEFTVIDEFVAWAQMEPRGIDAASVAQVWANQTLANLVRELVGNPFQPVAFAAEWRTDTAMLLARQMYESRDFGAMPILADALQDAGCHNADILNHCRDTHAEHVRGCWVVDCILRTND